MTGPVATPPAGAVPFDALPVAVLPSDVLPIDAPAAGASSGALAAWLDARGDAPGGPPVVEAEPGPLLRAVLGAALRRLTGEERGRAAVVLAADEPCVRAATRYGQRWTDTVRRLRPSDSVALETSELVRGLGEDIGWGGPLYLLAAPGAAGRQALLAACFLAAGGRRVVVAELVPAPDGAGADPAEESAGQPGWIAAAALWTGGPSDLPLEELPDTGPDAPGTLLGLARTLAEVRTPAAVRVPVGARTPAEAVPVPDPEESR
ncbi:hypothetical protein ACWGB8_27365 [Kitasatospora sp. NPDC054939]